MQNRHPRPLVIAHRGASAEAPENTMAAFRLALEQGCDAVELDVHLSRDGMLFVCHDDTVNRTTDGTGRIALMSADELRRLDAGRRFHEKYEGERVPFLEEVFDLLPSDMPINVEIKGHDNPGIVRALLKLLQVKNRMDSVFVSSFHYECLLALKRLEPAVRIGLLYNAEAVHYRAWAERFAVSLYSVHPHHKFVTREFVASAREYGVSIYPWTVDDETRIRELAEAGVSGIITNKPGECRALLQTLRQ